MVEVSEHESSATPLGPTDRERARARVERKHKLRADLVAYVVINVALIGAWAATGFGYFWPAWVLGFWGVFCCSTPGTCTTGDRSPTKRSNERYATGNAEGLLSYLPQRGVPMLADNARVQARASGVTKPRVCARGRRLPVAIGAISSLDDRSTFRHRGCGAW